MTRPNSRQQKKKKKKKKKKADFAIPANHRVKIKKKARSEIST